MIGRTREFESQGRVARAYFKGAIEATFTLAPVTGPFISDTGVSKKRRERKREREREVKTSDTCSEGEEEAKRSQ